MNLTLEIRVEDTAVAYDFVGAPVAYRLTSPSPAFFRGSCARVARLAAYHVVSIHAPPRSFRFAPSQTHIPSSRAGLLTGGVS